MATHSNVLAWRIPGTGGLVGCCLWGCTESDMIEVTQQQQQQQQQQAIPLGSPGLKYPFVFAYRFYSQAGSCHMGGPL